MNLLFLVVCIFSCIIATSVITAVLVRYLLYKRMVVQNKQDEIDDTLLYAKLNNIEDKIDRVETSLELSMKNPMRVILHTIIKKQALYYIEHEKISREDRELLHDMWDVYHVGCGGNGELTELMGLVDELKMEVYTS